MKKSFTFAAILISTLAGCAQSTTKAEFDCPVQDGIPACLTTEQADGMGELPKPEAGADPKTALNIETESKNGNSPAAVITKVATQDQDTSYKVQPLVHQPLRSFGGTERIWFAGWEDKKNDIYLDQQYIYWSKPGTWVISEIGK
ncbi:TraV family lipoprotein [Vibrio fluvialis]|uniref:TraV family lipoprotein n=1 Tax=Vibrio fluvialis TaxID=676 RepID=UPI0018EF0E4A|nr:TraV family lipoprotein [Vibrio fluvialis]